MSAYYAVISALVFAVVAVAHLIRLVNRWAVQLGPYSVPMSVSWIGLVIRYPDLSLGLRAISLLVHRFQSSNHIRRLDRVCKTTCGRPGPG